MRKNFATTGCNHALSTYQPSYTHLNCSVCGAIGTDSQWGIASDAWFDSIEVAAFYQKNGRLPDMPPDPKQAKPVYRNGDCIVEHLGEVELADGRKFNGAVISFPIEPPELPFSIVWDRTPLSLSIRKD